jgi:DNA-binding Lrp family transcriptional regulator
LDEQVIHGLRLDGRVGFSQLVGVLGVSDQTVARRYRRMREAGVLRVVARPDPVRLGQEMWLLRLRCTPDAATGVADALAQRSDTTWVSLSSGGTEIICISSGLDTGELLLQKLPRTPRVISVSAHLILRRYVGGPTDWFARPEALRPDQIAQLAQPAPDGTARVDDADGPLLAALAQDGRTAYPELARATGWSESTVRRRLEQLRGTGSIFFDVEVGPVVLGLTVRVMLWASVAPAHLAAVGAALSHHREVVFAAATTGPSNLAATVVCRDAPALYDYLTHGIGALPGVDRVETAPHIRTVKQLGTV